MTTLEQHLSNLREEREAMAATNTRLGVSLRKAIRKADAADWSKTRIAQVAGISRQTVHEILRNS